MYEPPEDLILHHNSVRENLDNALVGIFTVQNTQNAPLSLTLIKDDSDAFEVRDKKRLYFYTLQDAGGA